MVITVPANDGISGEVKFSIKYIRRKPGFCDSYEVIAAADADSPKVVHFWEQTLCIEGRLWTALCMQTKFMCMLQ